MDPIINGIYKAGRGVKLPFLLLLLLGACNTADDNPEPPIVMPDYPHGYLWTVQVVQGPTFARHDTDTIQYAYGFIEDLPVTPELYALNAAYDSVLDGSDAGDIFMNGNKLQFDVRLNDSNYYSEYASSVNLEGALNWQVSGKYTTPAISHVMQGPFPAYSNGFPDSISRSGAYTLPGFFSNADSVQVRIIGSGYLQKTVAANTPVVFSASEMMQIGGNDLGSMQVTVWRTDKVVVDGRRYDFRKSRVYDFMTVIY